MQPGLFARTLLLASAVTSFQVAHGFFTDTGNNMKSIGTRFSVAIGVFAILFSGIVLYQAWSSGRHYARVLTSHQAQLALEFDLAIREYVGEAIRPEMAKRIGEDEFILPAMSTSYAAREIAEKVRRHFPDYLLKFPSDNPAIQRTRRALRRNCC